MMSNTDQPSPGNWYVRRRMALSMAAHALLFSLGLLIAFALRYDFRLRYGEDQYWFTSQFLTYLPLALVIKLAVFGVLGLYRDSWRYVGLRDLFSVIRASHFSIFLCVVVYFLSSPLWRRYLPEDRTYWFPPSVFLLDWVLTIATVSTARVGFRFYHEELRPLSATAQHRLLIVGAGDVGDTILRDIIRTSEDRYLVIGFLDDNPAKQGGRIRGIECWARPASCARSASSTASTKCSSPTRRSRSATSAS
jgi:FlaA1/EpsC-like NDP-sugar epimerase